MGEFSGKVVVVTGGTKGIGEATVRRFCEQGAHTIIVSRNGQECQAYAEDLQKEGLCATGLAADISKLSDIKKLVQTLISRFGAVDVLVNNAAVNTRKPALEFTEEEWDQMIDINLKGTYFCCIEFGRHMVERKSGAIVNMASLASHIVLPGRSAYAATKGGIYQFSKGLANEWAKSGVRVNTVSPGFINTRLIEKNLADPYWVNLIESRTPMGRVGQREEVADVILYLASSRAAYVTGADLRVDGGWTAA
jgi:2-deoxy-D-gluconate 3-dehydrogenase